MNSLTESFFSEISQQNPDSVVHSYLQKYFIDPSLEVIKQKGKAFRSRLVQAGFHLSTQGQNLNASEWQAAAEEVVEILHGASLVIDDIQDQAQWRRGQKPFYQIYGTPLSINTGTWLYFLPFKIMERLNLSNDTLRKVHSLISDTLIAAHMGQSLDLGITNESLSELEFEPISLQTMRLKTGALMSLTLALPALLFQLSEEKIQCVQNFGYDLGIFLQMCDDLGNLDPQSEEEQKHKQFEDIRNKKVTFVDLALQKWASASEKDNYLQLRQEYLANISTLTAKNLETFINHSSFLVEAKKFAQSFIKKSYQQLQTHFNQEVHYDSLRILHNIIQDIDQSYA